MAMRQQAASIARFISLCAILMFTLGTLAGCTLPPAMTMEQLQTAIASGETAPGAQNRLLVVDVRTSADFIAGHIKDALTAPLDLIADGSNPYYTNGYDEVSITVEPSIAASWLAHLLINQLVNDFVSTYQDSRIVFYGDAAADGRKAARIAREIGYTSVSYLSGDYRSWSSRYSSDTAQYCAGIESVNEEEGSFIMNGYVNNTNFANVSTRGTHNCIIYDGGGLHNFGMFQVKVSPFCFQELLTNLGVSPEGNMADGIYFGEMDEWGSKFPDGEPIEYSITWDGAARFYTLDELFEEGPSEFQPPQPPFVPAGIEARLGGTRDSNLNFNPGCIYCSYACVCGITSNARANEETWFGDGGTYDGTDDPRNYYAGRYYPRKDILPGEGEPVRIKVKKAN